MTSGIQYKPNPLTGERQGQNSPDAPGSPGNDERFPRYLTQRNPPFIGFAIIVNIKCKTIEVTTTDFHQASRERPVSGHGQVRESVENGGGRPARYALARRRVVIFFR
ncbi:MAG: hypothetical protein ABSF52_06720 [Syntrophobacteraceae bacterium]|jgi:hypothetical protein